MFFSSRTSPPRSTLAVSAADMSLEDWMPVNVISDSLQAQRAQTWMIVGSASQLPTKLPLGFLDHHVIDAGMAHFHQSQLVKLPVLVPIRAKPVAGIVTPFIGKTHGDARAFEGPHLFDQPVFEFLRPFSLEELDDGSPAREKLGAIAPRA